MSAFSHEGHRVSEYPRFEDAGREFAEREFAGRPVRTRGPTFGGRPR
ncbi:hypothetical protein ABZT03_16465 [Streptomyces sp. NPDC005574]